jgi:hypothetical protein
VTDLDVEQPAVVSINGVIASLAVTEMLRRMTGMGGANDPAVILLYRLADGTVRRVRRPNGNCAICAGPSAGLGDLGDIPGLIHPNQSSAVSAS